MLVKDPGSFKGSELGLTISQRKSLCHTQRELTSDIEAYLFGD